MSVSSAIKHSAIKTLPLIIQNTLQPLFECGPISRVLKTTTQGAFWAQTRQPETCLPNNKCLFNYSHLPKNGHKYCCRQARLAGEQPEALGPNRLLALRVGLFRLTLSNPETCPTLPDCTQLCPSSTCPVADKKGLYAMLRKNASKWSRRLSQFKMRQDIFIYCQTPDYYLCPPGFRRRRGLQFPTISCPNGPSVRTVSDTHTQSLPGWRPLPQLGVKKQRNSEKRR